jgi:hypothetical protein
MMLDAEDILGLTPIHGLPDGGLYASDSEARTPALKPPPRFDPHTPLDPRPWGFASRPAGDLPTPLDPHAESFVSIPASSPDGGLPYAHTSSIFAAAHDSSDDSDDARYGESRYAFTTPARSVAGGKESKGVRAASAASTRYRHDPNAADATRPTRSAERPSRRRRSARAANDADIDLDLEPILQSLRSLTRELRDVFVDTFVDQAVAPRSLYSAPRGGYAHGTRTTAPSLATTSWSRPHAAYSLGTRQQLAAARSPLHRSSFTLGNEQFVLTVSRQSPAR